MIIDRVLKIIQASGLSQTKFAEKIGVDKSDLSKIIRRQRPLGEGKIARIVSRTGVSEHWLRTGEGEMFPQSRSPEPTPREYALSRGCGALAADVFAGYCDLTEEDKQIFEKFLEKFVSGRLAKKPLPSYPPDSRVIVNNATSQRGDAVINQTFGK